jgi:hypothetical protein
MNLNIAVKLVKKKSKVIPKSFNLSRLGKMNQPGGGRKTVKNQANFGKEMVKKGVKNGQLPEKLNQT